MVFHGLITMHKTFVIPQILYKSMTFQLLKEIRC